MQQGARLSPANSHHHFQLVAIRELLGGEGAARHDFAVALQRDAFAGVAQYFDQRGNVDGYGELAACAVDADGNHV